MSRVVHFELGVADTKRAVEFYRTVFGWKITKWDGPEDYWLVTTGEAGVPGIDGAILVNRDAQTRTVNTVEVDDLDACAGMVVQHGGEVVVEKMAIPGVGYQIYCRDTEGNLFGVHQVDPEAKPG